MYADTEEEGGHGQPVGNLARAEVHQASKCRNTECKDPHCLVSVHQVVVIPKVIQILDPKSVMTVSGR